MSNNFVSLVSDTTFKYLFKNEDTRKFLEEIILGKTDIDLTGYILVDNEENSGNKIKDYRMDLVLKKDNSIVIIEMNSEYSDAIEIKGRQYLYRKASHGLEKGDKYQDVPNVKLIMFNNYYNRNRKDIKTIKYELCNSEYNLKYSDIEIHEIYLKAFNKLCYDKYSEIDKRLCLFTINDFEEMRNLIKDDETLRILKELERLGMDNDFMNDYDYEKVQKKLMNSIRYEGYEEGVQNEKIEIAKKLLLKNVDENTILETTGLTIEEIEKLKLEM